MKQIAFMIVDNGIDGREPDSVRFASWSEEQRNAAWDKENPANRPFFSKTEKIVDLEDQLKKSKAKLDGLDRLVLGMT